MTDQDGRQRVGQGPAAVTMERVADGVWLMRGGALPPFVERIMNVYFVEDDGGVTVFDAGVRSMARHIAAVGRTMEAELAPNAVLAFGNLYSRPFIALTTTVCSIFSGGNRNSAFMTENPFRR